MSCASRLRSSRPGMTRILTYRPAPCHVTAPIAKQRTASILLLGGGEGARCETAAEGPTEAYTVYAAGKGRGRQRRSWPLLRRPGLMDGDEGIQRWRNQQHHQNKARDADDPAAGRDRRQIVERRAMVKADQQRDQPRPDEPVQRGRERRD